MPGQMIKLIWPGPADDAAKMGGILKCPVVQKKPLVQQIGIGHQVADIAGKQRIRAMDQPVDFIILLEQ